MLLHLLVMKHDYSEMKQHVGMYMRSRLRIIGIKLFPPKHGLDPRLEMDIEALFTMDTDEQDEYRTWLTNLRETYYRKERESDFSPEFKARLKMLRSMR